MLIKMAKQNGEEGLVLDNELRTKSNFKYL